MDQITDISTNDINMLCLKRQTNTILNGKYESNIHFPNVQYPKKTKMQINIERVKG